jgi:hypothetical protein
MYPDLQIEERAIGLYGLEDLEDTDERLANLLEINSLSHDGYLSPERDNVETMTRPIGQEKAFGQFGLMLGALGPLSIGGKVFATAGNFNSDQLWFLFLFLAATTVTSTVGYFTGKVVGNLVAATNKFRLFSAILLLFLIGTVWGAVSGFAGGLLLLLIGSIFGAFIGAAFGGLATLIFGVLYRQFQVAGSIERRYFLPFAFGTTIVLCAVILGL